MNLGIRGRLFILSLGVIAATVLVLNAYVSSELRSAIEERMVSDLRVRALLIAHEVEAPGVTADWQEMAEQLGRRALARATLIAADGTVLGDSEVARDRIASLENHAERPEVRDALRTGSGVAERASATIHHDLLYVATQVHGAGPVAVVRLSESLAPVETAAARARHLVFVGTLIAILIAGALSTVGSHLLSRSIRDLRRAAVAMVDDLSVRTRLQGADEVGELAQALDRLADNLSRSLLRLASERDRLEAILETMAEGVLLTGPTGEIVLANASLRTMLGTTAQVMGKQPIEAIRNDQLAEIINAVAGTPTPRSGEVDLVGIVARRVRVRAAPLAGGADRGVVAVLSDVTDLRRLESIRRDFVANVSHELRTPIAAIRAAAETLEGGAVDDPAACREFIGMIARHSQRLHQLVEDLLELSRIEAQKLDLAPTKIEVEPLLKDMIGLYVLSASRRGLTLSAGKCPPDLVAVADRRALEQVLSNLIDNAIKYASPGGIITLHAEERDEEICVSVADTGPGIPAKHLPRLFERFYRVDLGRSRDVGGTGLGLSIVKHLTEALGGRIAVESAPGRGSTFTVHLPVIPPPRATEAAAQPLRPSDARIPH